MVAVVNVSVVFHDKAVPACLAHRTDSRLDTAVLGKGSIEHLDVIIPHIAYDPFLEYVDQEFSVGFCTDAPRGQAGSFRLWGYDKRAMPVRYVNDVLHSRKELHIMAADGLEERIYLLPSSFAHRIDHAQGIELDSIILEHLHRIHHPAPGRPPLLVPPESVVDVLRAVQ